MFLQYQPLDEFSPASQTPPLPILPPSLPITASDEISDQQPFPRSVLEANSMYDSEYHKNWSNAEMAETKERQGRDRLIKADKPPDFDPANWPTFHEIQEITDKEAQHQVDTVSTAAVRDNRMPSQWNVTSPPAAVSPAAVMKNWGEEEDVELAVQLPGQPGRLIPLPPTEPQQVSAYDTFGEPMLGRESKIAASPAGERSWTKIQDQNYEMRLMFLEQQNKLRFIKAREEAG